MGMRIRALGVWLAVGAILLPAWSVAYRTERATAGLAPEGESIFVDSGQALGNTQSSAVASGDVDGDGDVDVYVASAGEDALWLNDGSGAFTEATQSLSNAFALSAALGDLDGDGDLDLFLGTSGANEVWRNNGTGAFSNSGQELGDSNSNDVALADVDGDGDLDAVAANGDATSPPNRLWINNGGIQGGVAGAFDESSTLLGAGWSNSVAVGDLDGQNGPDIYFARMGADEVWFNDGSGLFTWRHTPAVSPINSMDAALGDLDGDGDLDVWIANAPNASEILINEGGAQGSVEGSFVNGQQGLGANRAVTLGDLDGDLDLDAVTVFDTSSSSKFGVWLNDGQGNFTFTQDGGANYADLSVGALDGEGAPDLFLVKNGPDEVWLNVGAYTPQADVSVTLPPTEYNQSSATGCSPAFTANFEMSVHNAGPDTATNVTVESSAGTFDLLQRSKTHHFGDLSPGQSASITLYDVPRRAAQGGTITCIASARVWVTSSQVDANVDNNSDESAEVSYHCDELCSIETIFCVISPPTESLLAPPEDEPGASLLQSIQDTAIDLLVYYYVRERVLTGTESGQHFINLYEAHDDEIQEILSASAEVSDEGISTLQLWEPNLWALVKGKGHTAVITGEQVDAVDNFLDTLVAEASPALRQTIADERAALPAPETFIGMSMEEARRAIVGYGVFAPVVRN